MLKKVTLILIGLGLGTVWSGCTATEPVVPPAAAKNYLEETPAEKDARLQWWREARFGMFIHWGLYAVPAGEYQGQRSDRIGEWIQEWANIPREAYANFAKEFNPVKFNAAEWAQLAQDAGMKYLVITSKHHDGFSMFDSSVSDYDIVDSTPYGKDPMAELSQECRKRGIRFCFYYSIMDWHHPSQHIEKEGKNRTAGDHQNVMAEGQKEVYVTYMKGQLRELIEKYDPAVLWFDGEWVKWWTPEDGKELYNYLRSLKPSLIINNRIGKGRDGMRGLNKGAGYAGDFGTPEQEIPATGLAGVDWESCMTMNKTWGFKSYDHNWKSTQALVRNLIDIASKGGNYLLNIGPTAEGEIPPESVRRLKEIGEWTRVYGDSLYGTSASPFPAPEWGRATTKGNKVFLQVFDWPRQALKVPPLENEVVKAYLMNAPERELETSRSAEGISVQLPQAAPDTIASVVVLELDGAPRVRQP